MKEILIVNRSNCVANGPSSLWVSAPFGVPQGSVVGPLLYMYLPYTADIGPLLTQLGLLHRLFADDVQAYVDTYPLSAETVLTQMSQAIDISTSWMTANRLLISPNKTQAILLGGHRQLAKIDGQRFSSVVERYEIPTRKMGLSTVFLRLLA